MLTAPETEKRHYFPGAFMSYAPVPNCVARMVDLTSDAKLIYARLYYYGNDKMEDVDCDPSHARLAREFGMSEEQVRNALKLLIKRKMLRAHPPRTPRERVIYEALITKRMANEAHGEGYGDDENL